MYECKALQRWFVNPSLEKFPYGARGESNRLQVRGYACNYTPR